MARPKALGAYEIEGDLGRGGMGEVFLARHPLLERQVALKRLLLPPSTSEEQAKVWRERFLREGRALAKLTHEGIVAVHDLFEHRGQLCMAMELVDGFPLAELLRAGPLPPDVALIITARIARALEAAHHAGILHRDIKPANVMISRRGVVKLMDFGIAKDEDLHTLTSTGELVGTPNYLAPELVKGQVADARSDLYGLGATLYEMLSGRRLFQHATAESIWAMVAGGRWLRLGKIAPHLPWRLILLVERCLKTDPKRRFASASELRRALEAFLESHGGPADESARLVGYLCAVGKIVEADAMTLLRTAELRFDEVVPLRPKPQLWRTAALASLALCLGLLGWIGATTGALAPLLEQLRSAVP